MIMIFKLSSGTELMADVHHIDEDGTTYVSDVLEVVTESVMTHEGLRLLTLPRLYSTHIGHGEVFELNMADVLSVVVADDVSESYYGFTYHGLLRDETARRAGFIELVARRLYDPVDVYATPEAIM